LEIADRILLPGLVSRWYDSTPNVCSKWNIHNVKARRRIAASQSRFPWTARGGDADHRPEHRRLRGLEEATVIYHPHADLRERPDHFPNMIDEGPMMIRTTLRNYYPTLGWWDGDRATTNDDRQRTEVKGIDGLAHQKQFQTYEYSFDFRTNPASPAPATSATSSS
jgi:hypothetical protein